MWKYVKKVYTQELEFYIFHNNFILYAIKNIYNIKYKNFTFLGKIKYKKFNVQCYILAGKYRLQWK